MHTTNYFSAFIVVSPDTKADAATVPPKPDSVAGLQHALLSAQPYSWTSDDLLFEILCQRKGIAEADRPAARAEYFSKGQPCLRSSPLVKQYGWGLHYDAEGRIALCGMNSERYAQLAESEEFTPLVGMRSSRS